MILTKLIRGVAVTLAGMFLAVPGLAYAKAAGAMTMSEPGFHRVSQDGQLLQPSSDVMPGGRKDILYRCCTGGKIGFIMI